MLPDHLWPVLFCLALLLTIVIFATLLYTVTSILLERHNDEAQRAARESSPDEGYRTFERSFGPGEDDDEIRPAAARRSNTGGSLVIPNRFLNREGLRGDGGRRLRRHGQTFAERRETFDERRVSRPPSAAQRALMGVRGTAMDVREGERADSLVRPPARERDGKNPARYAYAGAEEPMFDMSV
ncbi:hypothetical protein BBK36DRAFT_145540 [Trichoderma citrinoviride]|uniref:Uncharacterized protein n=1 Tax=Trichoderma citrinoviride TaxID=58853 RepID=A0A2T4B2B7_9HYPO|nr:hypothetical protein BBK36DRAFT_145540 [Trichoderma citrinoviride]PTB63467.1 hypothetical protein BBK36DRAFT_145540 [Trichoderma citrinoviride]